MTALEAAVTTLQEAASAGLIMGASKASSGAKPEQQQEVSYRPLPQHKRAENYYSNPLPHREAAVQGIPIAMRTEGIIGNLGWDLEPDVLTVCGPIRSVSQH
jgi:hypothetical protein